MKYINQLEYEHIPYPTDMETPGSKMQEGNVKIAGCGLCSLCMVVDQLTMKSLPLRRCVEMAVQSGANHAAGTDLKILGPLVAEKYGLTYGATDDIAQAVRCLQMGGRVIANVGGDRDEGTYTGVFSHGGHYITLISADEREICVLDPSWRADKFDEPGRPGKVRVEGKLVYCSYEVMEKDAENRSPRYYLFARK